MTDLRCPTSRRSERLKELRLSITLEIWLVALALHSRSWRPPWLTTTRASLSFQQWTTCCLYLSTVSRWLIFRTQPVSSKWCLTTWGATREATSLSANSSVTLMEQSDTSAMTGNLTTDSMNDQASSDPDLIPEFWILIKVHKRDLQRNLNCIIEHS